MDSEDNLKQIAERIAETEGKRGKLGEFVKKIGNETGIIIRVEPHTPADMRIAAVDGGLLKKSLHGFDFILVRAAAVCFTYRNGKMTKVEYHPSKNPKPRAEVLEALSDLDWAYAAGISRLLEESGRAIEAMEKFSPDFLLLDGSIAPHYADRPSRGSGLYEGYCRVLENYKKLYRLSKETGTVLAGIVEDSRNTSFCGMIKRDILSMVTHRMAPELAGLLEKTRDTNLLYLAMERGERTRVFPYSESPEEHPVLRDLGDYARDLKSFYLKTAEHDRPIKVDMLHGNEDILSSVLLSISGHHSGYGLPAPIIEADNVAKLPETEMETFYSRIMKAIGSRPGILRLRRDSRPF